MNKSLKLILVFAAAGLSGCGESGRSLSGMVTYDGAPVADGRIALRPEPGAAGMRTVQTVIKDGAFHFPSVQQVLPGKYSVVVTGRRKTNQRMLPEEGSTEVEYRYEQYLPPRYNTDTTLSIEVVGDDDALSFELSSQAAARK